MKKLIIATIIAVMGTTMFAEDLPPKIQTEQYMVAAKKFMDSKDYTKAGEYLEKIIALKESAPEEFNFLYGKYLLNIKKYQKSREYLIKFIKNVDKSKPTYIETLELITDAEEGIINEEFRREQLQKRLEQLKSINTFLMVEKGENDAGKIDYNFSIGKYEVTQKEWKLVIGENNPSNFSGDMLPVEKINFYDAIEYCNKRSELEGLEKCYTYYKNGNKILNDLKLDTTKNGYRLPTSLEWEYAARGGLKSKKYKFSGADEMDNIGWFERNSEAKTHEVGKKQPNELGIFDMSGNVWEWCWDNFESNKDIQPVRGGSWYSFDYGCMLPIKLNINTGGESSLIGLRIVKIDRSGK